MKQPRVPEYRNGNVFTFLHTLVMFLKDFCTDVWQENQNMKKRLEALERGSE